MNDQIDTAVKSTKFIGDLATAAMTIGSPALTIIELLLPWIPGFGPVAADIAIALPIIQKIAQFAPVVSEGIADNRPLIEAVNGVGDALIAPLKQLMAAQPQLAINHPFFQQFNRMLIANEFKPQDPIFDRFGAGSQS